MILNIVIGLVGLVVYSAIAAPLPFANPIFGDFLWDGPAKESVIVKRRSLEEDYPQGQLKQISLGSLVEDLEKSIFASAQSLNKVLTDKHVTIPEIKANNESHDVATNSQVLTNEQGNKETAKREATSSLSKTENTVILQTTERVPQTVDAPTHIIIDRIAIQPHTGNAALIPIFDLEQTENVKDDKQEHDITTFANSKTGSAAAATTTVTPDSSSTTSTLSTTTTEDTSATTPINIEQLKEAEEELKGTLAEIEAEPVILTARV